MSNSSKVETLPASYTRFIAIGDGKELYFTERGDDLAIMKALVHFSDAKEVKLGFAHDPESIHDITALRAPKGWDKIEA
jgi:hypothetical protein